MELALFIYGALGIVLVVVGAPLAIIGSRHVIYAIVERRYDDAADWLLVLLLIVVTFA